MGRPQTIGMNTGTGSPIGWVPWIGKNAGKNTKNSESVNDIAPLYLSMDVSPGDLFLTGESNSLIGSSLNIIYSLARYPSSLFFTPEGDVNSGGWPLIGTPNSLSNSLSTTCNLARYISSLFPAPERDVHPESWSPIVGTNSHSLVYDPVERAPTLPRPDIMRIMEAFSSKREGVMSSSERKGLSDHIKLLHGAISETYRGFQYIEYSLLEDPDIPDRKQICFEIHIAGEPGDIIDDQRKFYRFLVRNIPSNKRSFFTYAYRVS